LNINEYNDKIAKRFLFDLRLGIDYKVKVTKKYKICYFVLDSDEPYTWLLKLGEVLNKIGFKKVGATEKYSNAIKIYLNSNTYRVVNVNKGFDSITSPKNRIPDCIKK